VTDQPAASTGAPHRPRERRAGQPKRALAPPRSRGSVKTLDIDWTSFWNSLSETPALGG
jgi:hypothetical protein